MAKARKQISRTVDGNKETVINEYYEFHFDDSILSDIEEDIFEDWEYGNESGVYSGEDGVFKIIVDDCIEELKNRCFNDEEDNEVEKRIINYLEKYKGFSITL